MLREDELPHPHDLYVWSREFTGCADGFGYVGIDRDVTYRLCDGFRALRDFV